MEYSLSHDPNDEVGHDPETHSTDAYDHVELRVAGRLVGGVVVGHTPGGDNRNAPELDNPPHRS